MGWEDTSDSFITCKELLRSDVVEEVDDSTKREIRCAMDGMIRSSGCEEGSLMASERDVLLEVDVRRDGDQYRGVKGDIRQWFVWIDGENSGETCAASQVLSVRSGPRKSRPRLVARHWIEEEQVQLYLRLLELFACLA